MNRRDLALLVVLLVAFVAVRGVWLQDTFGDRSLEPLEFGQLAHDLPHGLLAPLPAYLPQANEGCGVVFGVWCAPAVVVLGDSFLTLRLCHLAWHALALGILFALGLRLGGRWGAVAACALYVLPSPGLGTMMHRGWFNHLEAWVLLGGALLLHGPTTKRTAGAGALLGLAVFFQLSALPAAGAVAGVLLWRGRRGPLLIGGIVGALPWILASWVGEPVAGSAASDVGSAAPDLWAFVTASGPQAFGYRGNAPWGTGTLLGAIVGAALIGSAALGSRSGRDRTLVWVAATAPLAHLAACLVSGLDLAQARYLAPLWPWLLLLLAGLGRGAWVPAAPLLLLHALQLMAVPPDDDRMPLAFEAALTGHSALQHDGLRHALEGRGSESLELRHARYDVCRLLARGGGAIEEAWWRVPDCAAGAAFGRGSTEDARGRMGAFARNLSHEGRELGSQLAGADPLRCAAAGHWAFETGWHGGSVLDRARGLCGDAALAVGAGMALAPRLRADAPAPDLRWWWRDRPPDAQAAEAFVCAARAERQRGPSPVPPLDCAAPSRPGSNR